MKSFMDMAYEQALKAYAAGEIPIGAVIVKGGKVIARGHNVREKKQIATAHAEIVAIEKACKKLKSWRLDDCEMYVTIEPCVMCFGAVMNARIPKVYYGADDLNGGAFKLYDSALLNWNAQFIKLENEERCSELLTEFFKKRRLSPEVKKPWPTI
ncbi:MAG: nucleoside deaminase [Clostridia bacterium]|nr:nucleoside deaminase [Clostridia bacterium]